MSAEDAPRGALFLLMAGPPSIEDRWFEAADDTLMQRFEVTGRFLSGGTGCWAREEREVSRGVGEGQCDGLGLFVRF